MRKSLSMGAAFSLLVGCSAGSDPNSSSPSPGGVATGPYKLEAHVAVTWPGAACTIEFSDGNARPLKYYADDYGEVHLSIGSQGGATREGVALDCATDAGDRGRFVTEPEANFVRLANRPLAPGHTMRPALSREEALSLSSKDLLARGYPPRPDATRLPQQFSRWLVAVSSPSESIPRRATRATAAISNAPLRARAATGSRSTVSAPSAIPLTECQELPVFEQTWGGEIMNRPWSQYTAAGGTLIVPTLIEPADGLGESFGGFWVGLGGRWNDDLLQAGAGFERRYDWGHSRFYVSIYPFFEYFQSTASSPDKVGFAISPGQDLLVEIWRGDGSGNEDANGWTGWAYLENLTTHTHLWDFAPLGAGYTGGSAEWIMERNESCNGTALPNYWFTVVSDIWAHRDNVYDDFSSDTGNLEQVQLVNASNQVLSEVQVSSATQAVFSYHQGQ